jgi:acyl-CoA synthetase (AMP-forming)/AMP-acid ligase II
MPLQTIWEILESPPPGKTALTAPGRPPMAYGALRTHVQQVAALLHAKGVASGDRIAIVLPNGPEMAVAFLAAAIAGVAAPLNPAYRREEFDFYLSDLGAKILLLPEGETGPAAEAAEARGISLLRLRVDAATPAGTLIPLDEALADPNAPIIPGRDAEALVLHTSGTTSRPKIVPLSHGNVAASADAIMRSAALTEADHCLNIMPLFHIHGLIAAVLASLRAGASICCTPGFNALRFFAWLASEKPSWYTAVPTMHQAIIERGQRQREAMREAKLRFIRSSSASLPPTVLEALEAGFGCPVIEAYGMTEAAHQMTCNPLPPGMRKPGTVGIAAGPAVRIADHDGNFLQQGAEGEIVISGPNVTQGYAQNPDANKAAFFAGEGGTGRWFRTGDLGRFDADGYLTVTGRIKEIINRGGEKIAPREVDEVLLQFEGVQQAVTFAMPHPKLGEEVAAVVVCAAGVTEQMLKDFAAERLAPFKLPRTIVFVDEIPKGATGKVQRIGLAQKLGLA